MMNHNPESVSPYEFRPLSDGERVESFDCGDADLNDFIVNMAHLYQQEMLAVTYVIEEAATKKILAYFSLMNDKISLSEFENKTEFNRFRKRRFVNAKRLTSYPALKIGRLAVSKEAKELNLRLGSAILNWIKISFTNSSFVNIHKTGCRFLTVDAYVDAIPFYEKNDFEAITESDKEDRHTRLLYYDLSVNKK